MWKWNLKKKILSLHLCHPLIAPAKNPVISEIAAIHQPSTNKHTVFIKQHDHYQESCATNKCAMFETPHFSPILFSIKMAQLSCQFFSINNQFNYAWQWMRAFFWAMQHCCGFTPLKGNSKRLWLASIVPLGQWEASVCKITHADWLSDWNISVERVLLLYWEQNILLLKAAARGLH